MNGIAYRDPLRRTQQSLNNPSGFYLFSLSLPESKLSEDLGKINNPE
jgi:hypothetical protein